ncbi:MAG: nucleotide exchange factor GrpE [Bacillota bacterium]
MEQAAEQSNLVNEGITVLREEINGNHEQLADIEVLLNKLARVQYKTSQDIQGKLDRLTADIEAVQQWQTAHEIDKDRLIRLERQVDYLAETLIAWLDDIDLVLSRLQGEGQTWVALLEQWATQLVRALAENGIHELELLGRSFQPQWAEAIGTVTRSALPTAEDGRTREYVPYEVLKVIKRGFGTEDGRLIRKAQVITLKEEEADDHKQ